MTTTPPAGTSWRAARLTSPMVRSMAGHRLIPLWAVVHHRGRRTGRDLSVPVAVLRGGDELVIALPWGPGTNWARNVLAAGGCVLRWKGEDVPVTRPEVIGLDRARAYYNRFTWAVVRRVFTAEHFLLLRTVPTP